MLYYSMIYEALGAAQQAEVHALLGTSSSRVLLSSAIPTYMQV